PAGAQPAPGSRSPLEIVDVLAGRVLAPSAGMTRRRLVATATLLSLAACGSRTGLDLASGAAGDAGGPTYDAAPTGSSTPDAAADAPLDSPSDLVAPRATSPLSTSRV